MAPHCTYVFKSSELCFFPLTHQPVGFTKTHPRSVHWYFSPSPPLSPQWKPQQNVIWFCFYLHPLMMLSPHKNLSDLSKHKSSQGPNLKPSDDFLSQKARLLTMVFKAKSFPPLCPHPLPYAPSQGPPLRPGCFFRCGLASAWNCSHCLEYSPPHTFKKMLYFYHSDSAQILFLQKASLIPSIKSCPILFSFLVEIIFFSSM